MMFAANQIAHWNIVLVAIYRGTKMDDTGSSSHSHRQLDLQQEVRSTLALLSPVKVSGFNKRRVGGTGDGGYVMLDDLSDIRVCYSLGVGPDVSWDLEMAERGAEIFQYDHTVDQTPSSHRNFHHFKVGISHDDLIAPNLRRIDTLVHENGHALRRDMVLKIDIEGSEWDSLSVLSSETFGQFRQILCEIHGLRMIDLESFRARAVALFNKLRTSHHCIHVHGNNFGGMAIVAGTPIADVLELTYVRKADYVFQPSDEVFPTFLDGPNNTNLPDLFLGTFQFK